MHTERNEIAKRSFDRGKRSRCEISRTACLAAFGLSKLSDAFPRLELNEHFNVSQVYYWYITGDPGRHQENEMSREKTGKYVGYSL